MAALAGAEHRRRVRRRSHKAPGVMSGTGMTDALKNLSIEQLIKNFVKAFGFVF